MLESCIQRSETAICERAVIAEDDIGFGQQLKMGDAKPNYGPVHQLSCNGEQYSPRGRASGATPKARHAREKGVLRSTVALLFSTIVKQLGPQNENT